MPHAPKSWKRPCRAGNATNNGMVGPALNSNDAGRHGVAVFLRASPIMNFSANDILL
jgi:hypothetical protein